MSDELTRQPSILAALAAIPHGHSGAFILAATQDGAEVRLTAVLNKTWSVTASGAWPWHGGPIVRAELKAVW